MPKHDQSWVSNSRNTNETTQMHLFITIASASAVLKRLSYYYQTWEKKKISARTIAEFSINKRGQINRLDLLRNELG